MYMFLALCDAAESLAVRDPPPPPGARARVCVSWTQSDSFVVFCALLLLLLLLSSDEGVNTYV